MESRHVKSVNTDSRSKKRIRFASSKERSKRASADVYRSYKSRIGGGVTSAATREAFVHNPREERARKRQKKHTVPSSGGSKRRDLTAVVKVTADQEATNNHETSDNNNKNEMEEIRDDHEEELEAEMEITSTFASELDVALDRNASEIFSKFHRQIWMLVRSLPEILHNLDRIVDILMLYMLSPLSMPERPASSQAESTASTKGVREEFIVNLATTDILHLLAVLARDLRHEIHPYLHTKILPRIVNDLLNPPLPPPDSNRQPVPLDVAIVEAGFRTLAYIFRYDPNLDVESMRTYYGMTLGNRRELVRRLAAETFAPEVRKMKSQSARERHVRRVLRALAATSKQPTTGALQRTQIDAVDGLSQMLFQLIRGVHGKLHSQGARMIRFLLCFLADEENCTNEKQDLVFDVVSGMLDRLFHHFRNSSFVVVSKEMFSVFYSVLENRGGTKAKETAGGQGTGQASKPIVKLLQLIVQATSFKSGVLFEGHSAKDLALLCDSISSLCDENLFTLFSPQDQLSIVRLLCKFWASVQGLECVPIVDPVQEILKLNQKTSIVFAKELIPHLSGDIADRISRLLLMSLEEVTDRDEAMEVVYSVVSSRRMFSRDEVGTTAAFELFGKMEAGESGVVQPEQLQCLLEACLFDNWEGPDIHARLSVALICAPFLVTLHADGMAERYERAVNWIIRNCFETQKSSYEQDPLIVKGLALESMSFLTSEVLASSVETPFVKKSMTRLKPVVERLLLSGNQSLWVLRGLAALMPHVEKCGDIDAVFDSLVPNLRSPNHFVRLYTLQILASYPKKIFVVDHADLDPSLADLSDEDEAFRPSERKHGPVGECDALETLLKLESSPVRLTNERELLSLIGRVEVLARTGRLPVAYAEAAANHMFGVFRVKFAPLWPAAQKAIVALAASHETVVWPSFEAELVGVMNPLGGKLRSFEDIPEESSFYDKHFKMCQRWEDSNGENVDLFGIPSVAEGEGEVPCYHVTDTNTVMESVFRTAELSHKVVVRHSRVFVPLFLRFLCHQFFAFHFSDQDGRELQLGKSVEKENVDAALLQGGVLQRRLKAFLGVFAAIDGPKQLVEYRLLEKIFLSFLTHQDVAVVDLALSCLAKFKFDYLLPYVPLIKEILQKKGRLRDALLKLAEEVETKKMGEEHRKLLIPILSRVLFGRVTAKPGKSSSKDSPAARRAAVLSSLSVVCREDSDFFPFLYLMSRPFISSSFERKPIESFSSEDQINFMQALMSARKDDLISLSGPVIEGFLHLMESVIAQWGFRVVSWVPQLFHITVEICKLVAVNGKPQEKEGLRRGPIRTLCFQRLCELFTRFGSSVNFTQYSLSFWSALEPSLVMLPEMVVENEGCPAVLLLLRTMSAEPDLVKLLSDHEDAVGAVVRCIGATTRRSAMDASLTFVENLLTVEDQASAVLGQELVRKFTPQLMNQFAERLGSKETDDTPEKTKKASSRGKHSSSWRRELEILCHVSGFVTSGDVKNATTGDNVTYVETLFKLLLPFLEPARGLSDDDIRNVVQILFSLTSDLDSSTSNSVFSDISRALGPYRSREGIKTLSIRLDIASLVDKIAENVPRLKKITSLLVMLLSVDSKRVEEICFETAIPALNSLNDGETWKSLCDGPDSTPFDLMPLIQVCFNFLHNEDGVISRASFVGLKALVLAAASSGSESWLKLIETIVVPLSRSGLQSRESQIRRPYINLVREISILFRDDPSPALCGDLFPLVDTENPDMDFFLSVSHLQIHRRARAFQRIRKILLAQSQGSLGFQLSSLSLSNVLLPIALHPVYESKQKSEETFAMESIATLGAISRLLSWSKYNSLLWSVLSQFERYPDQQRYLVAAMCAIIDGFNFDLVRKDTESSESKTSVWRSLENRIIPKVEGLLSKETTDKSGRKVNLLRPSVLLALTRLFQKFPSNEFEKKLPSILTVICSALKNRDSSARDVARTTLGKLVVAIDLKYLPDVIRELAITLTEGYQLHVRAACVHTILLELSKVYEAPSDTETDYFSPPFDNSTIAFMDLIQADLFGEANERRESKETNVRFVKEAAGTKTVHAVELLARMISFKPSNARNGHRSRSAVHCVVGPFLERLRLPDVDAKIIRKIKEILSRVVVGISNNPSVTADELFPFVYASIQPFIGEEAANSVKHYGETTAFDSDDDDDDERKTIKVSGRKDTAESKESSKSKGVVVEWRPSTLQSSRSGKTAVEIKHGEQRKLYQVQDGASAPKLTGSSRHSLEAVNFNHMNNPASTAAIVFGLNLMSACMKKIDISPEKHLDLLDPFVPMLTACVCYCRNNEVTSAGLRCLLPLLRLELPSLPTCSSALSSKVLSFLSPGSNLNQNHELNQACFKTLERIHAKSHNLPLDSEQMRVLIPLLQVSVAETDQHNPALNLIKAILSRKYVSPEFYDLMEAMLKMVVRSQKPTLRQQSAGIFVRYLLDYPMAEEKFEQHLKQAVANISFEYQEGRLSGIALVTLIIEKLPQELLEKHTQLLFLPLVLQLINDDSKECRAEVSKSLTLLLNRSSLELLQTIEEYCIKWLNQTGPQRLASLEVFALLAETRADFFRKNGSSVEQWMGRLEANLHYRKDQSLADLVTYFSLVGIEKLSVEFGSALSQKLDLWSSITECLAHPHPWVKLSSSRILNAFFASNLATTFLAKKDGLLFDIIRNFCFQLNVAEDQQSEELSNLAIKGLTLALPLMNEHVQFCYKEEGEKIGAETEAKDPVFWLMRRLSQISKNKGSTRRLAVFKCYAAFASSNFPIVAPHLELMLEGLHRSIIEAQNELENHAVSQKRSSTSVAVIEQQRQDDQTRDSSPPTTSEYSMAQEVMRLLEESCTSPEEFLNAYAGVKRRAREKKEHRKLIEKTEAVQDPQAAAERRMKKQERNKQRRKRRAEEQRVERGGGEKKKRPRET